MLNTDTLKGRTVQSGLIPFEFLKREVITDDKIESKSRDSEGLKASGIKHWELAVAIGVDETTICRWLRKELPDEKKNHILNIIKSYPNN